MANLINSQNLRSLINDWKTSYTINYNNNEDNIHLTNINDTVSCVWDGQKYLVYNLIIDTKDASVTTDDTITYKYIGDGATFLAGVSFTPKSNTSTT